MPLKNVHIQFKDFRPWGKKEISKAYVHIFSMKSHLYFNFILLRKNEFGQEDCLYLNVFTPDLPITERQNKLPVMVWLFGATFSSGTSRDDIFGPERFMNSKDIVLVTVNYRIGVFGFLSLGIDTCPGNQVEISITYQCQKSKYNIYLITSY